MTKTIIRTTLRSDELSCPSCLPKIEKALRALPGVEQAEVRFNTGRILISHDPERAPLEALIRAVAESGYNARLASF